MSYNNPSRKHASRLSTPVRLGVAAVAACFISAPVLSLPLNPAVVNGAASFNQAGKVLTVTNSNGAIINWQKFSIQAGETTHFAQTAASSSVLNRVLNDPTAIYGTLSSNGRVWLVNPAGIMVGPGGRVDVAGFVASTLNISNADFLAGRSVFINDGGVGNVINQGEIRTPAGGSVYLIGSNVSNEGIITTPKGETILAAGATVSLVDSATPGVKVDITGSEGNATNLGTLTAEAGRIGIAGVIVRNSGTVNASSVVSEGGRVFLKASQDAYVDGNGRIVTTGTRGGSVEVLGNRVAVMGNAEIDASGTGDANAGGGRILVGGDYQGKNPDIQNANVTWFGPDATLKADAGKVGDGGTVIVWADDTTRAYGSISARGGALGGNGGFVEVSGHRYLDFHANVDTRAPIGKTGSLLLDPMNVQIVAYGGIPPGDPYLDSNGGSSSYGGTSGVFGSTGTSDFSTLYWETIDGQLVSNNVVVTTIGGGPTAYGDITLVNDHSYVSSNSLSLLAHRDIVAANRTLANAGSGGITLVAGWDGNTSPPGVGAGPGAINASGATFSTVGGAFNAQASDSITLGTINTNASPGSGNAGGEVYIKTSNGTLDVASISAIGGDSGAGVGGYGGKVTLWASGPLTVAGGVNAAGGDGYSGYDGGPGGEVTLESLSGNVTMTIGGIYADGGDGGSGNATYAGGKGGTGGAVTITASNGTITVGDISANGGGYGWNANSKGGYGGSISLNAQSLFFGNLFARGGDGGEGNAFDSLIGGVGGKGGSISLTATSVDIDFGYRMLDARGGQGGHGGDSDSTVYGATMGGRGGDGGKVVLLALASNGDILAGCSDGCNGEINASGGRGGNGGWDNHGVFGGGNGGYGGDAGGISLTGKSIILGDDVVQVRASGGDGGDGGFGYNLVYGGTGVYTVLNADNMVLCSGASCNGMMVYGGPPGSTTMIGLPTSASGINPGPTTAGGRGGNGGLAGNLVDESENSIPNIVLVATDSGGVGIQLGVGSSVESMGGMGGMGGLGRALPATAEAWQYYQQTYDVGLPTEYTDLRLATYSGTGVDGNEPAEWGGWGSNGWTHMASQSSASGIYQPINNGLGGLRTGRLTFPDLAGGGIVGDVSLLGQSNIIDSVSGHVTGDFTFDGRGDPFNNFSELYNIGESGRALTVGGKLLVHSTWDVGISGATVTDAATVHSDGSIYTHAGGSLTAASIDLLAKRDIDAGGSLTATAVLGGITLKAGWDFDGGGAPSGYGGDISLTGPMVQAGSGGTGTVSVMTYEGNQGFGNSFGNISVGAGTSVYGGQIDIVAVGDNVIAGSLISTGGIYLDSGLNDYDSITSLRGGNLILADTSHLEAGNYVGMYAQAGTSSPYGGGNIIQYGGSLFSSAGDILMYADRDITIDGSVTADSGSIYLSAGNNATRQFGGNISMSGALSGEYGVGLIAESGSSSGLNGNITQYGSGSITAGSGNVSILGGGSVKLDGSIDGGEGAGYTAVTVRAGFSDFTGTVTPYGGNISLAGTSEISGYGDVYLSAESGSASGANGDIIQNVGSIITADSGEVRIIGGGDVTLNGSVSAYGGSGSVRAGYSVYGGMATPNGGNISISGSMFGDYTGGDGVSLFASAGSNSGANGNITQYAGSISTGDGSNIRIVSARDTTLNGTVSSGYGAKIGAGFDPNSGLPSTGGGISFGAGGIVRARNGVEGAAITAVTYGGDITQAASSQLILDSYGDVNILAWGDARMDGTTSISDGSYGIYVAAGASNSNGMGSSFGGGYRAGSGSIVSVGVFDAIGGTVEVEATGPILRSAGNPDSVNIFADTVSLTSFNGRSSAGGIAISAFTEATGSITAEVGYGGAIYGGISIQNFGAQPGSISLTDKATNPGIGLNAGPASISFYNDGNLALDGTTTFRSFNSGDIAITSGGNLAYTNAGSLSAPGNNILLGAKGNLTMGASLAASGNLDLSAGSILNINNSVSGSNVTLLAPTVDIGGTGSVAATADAIVLGTQITIGSGLAKVKGANVFFGGGNLSLNGEVTTPGQLEFNLASVNASSGGSLVGSSPTSNITGIVSGNITLDGGARFAAGGDIDLTAAVISLNNISTLNGTNVTLKAPTVNIRGGSDVFAINTASVTGSTINIDGALSRVRATNVSFGGTAPNNTGNLSLSYGGAAQASGQLTFNLANVTASDGGHLSANTSNPNSNITGTVSGNIALDSGAWFEAGNDIHLTFTGGASTISTSHGSYLVSDTATQIPATIYLDFLTGTGGGVFIDGTATTTSLPGGSGFFVVNTSTPAVKGAGLEITYGGVVPPDTCATNPALCPPPPTDTCATNPALCPREPEVEVDPCISSPDLCKAPSPITNPISLAVDIVKGDPCATAPDSAQCKAVKSGEKEKKEKDSFGDEADDGKKDEKSSQKKVAQCGV